MRLGKVWAGLAAALLLPYAVTLAWNGGVGGRAAGDMKAGILGGRGQAEGNQERQAGTGLEGGKRIYINNGQKGYLPLEDYLVGIVARQIPAEYELEALKAQAIIARTYIYGKMEGKTQATESELGLAYLGETQMESLWGRQRFVEYYDKVRQAVRETEGLVMVLGPGEGGGGPGEGSGGQSGGSGGLGEERGSQERKGGGSGEGSGSQGGGSGGQGGGWEYVPEPLFHRASAGYTRDGETACPYLKSVDSHWDVEAEGYLTVAEWEPKEFVRLMAEAAARNGLGNPELGEEQVLDTIQLVGREKAGYVKEIQVGAHIYTGEEIRQTLGLPSAAFALEGHEGKLRAVCKGLGHGYGLSQYGANAMAREGKSAQDILMYYYQNIAIISPKRE